MYERLNRKEVIASKKPRKKRAGSWSQHILHNGVKFRSSWELFLSLVLVESNLQWVFEPKRFFLGNRISYLPDFFIPSMNLFIEVKGWMRDRDATKIRLFQETQSHRLIVFNEKEISYILGAPASTLAKTNLKLYKVSQAQVTRLMSLLGVT